MLKLLANPIIRTDGFIVILYNFAWKPCKNWAFLTLEFKFMNLHGFHVKYYYTITLKNSCVSITNKINTNG